MLQEGRNSLAILSVEGEEARQLNVGNIVEGLAKERKNVGRGSTVVKVLCYKSEGHWFDPSWCHWNFSLT